VDVKHFQANFGDDCTLVNGLGATECGLVRQFFINQQTHLDATEPIPIGYPVRDMVVRIIDADGREQPPPCIGEILVESRFLAMGYWDNPTLTEERFVEGQEGLRRYRTGDLGGMSSDGCLSHLGRVDHRIRIRGEFIDTVEMEKRLINLPGVSQVIVRDVVDHYGEARICAYVVTEPASGLDATDLRDELSRALGARPAPYSLVVLDALPLTKDLKIDLERLPLAGRQRPHLRNDYVAPQTALEKLIASIWSDVLRIDALGVTDSFFDLGGDSLHAVRIVNQLRADAGIEVSMSRLFEFRTIQQLARSLQGIAS
jgi:acyl-coenzyme A synthetase/AMP-(fatty) acid ligase/acyl carrier protein